MRLTADDLSEAASLLAVENEKLRVELTDELQSIARDYWEQHRDEERPSADWYKEKVGRIQKAAENLLKLLREPQGTALAQLRFRTERQMARRLLGGPSEEPPSVEQLLNDFVAVCKSCRFEAPPKGAPVKRSIKVAVAALTKVWIRFSEKRISAQPGSCR